MTYTILSLPLEERPRERLLNYGCAAISTTELIAIILGSGMKGKSVLEVAQELLVQFGGLKGLAEASVEELCQVKGLGQTKALQLKAAFSLGVKAAGQLQTPRYRIQSPLHVYNLVKDLFEQEKRELFAILMLDVRGCVIGQEVVSVGTLSDAIVHPREVFYPAIRRKAASIIITHNHPSGDCTPSNNDYTLTKTLVEAGKIIGIPVQDHLIVSTTQYCSLREKGVSFE